MLCYAKSLQSCPTLCDPIDGKKMAKEELTILRKSDKKKKIVHVCEEHAWEIYEGRR